MTHRRRWCARVRSAALVAIALVSLGAVASPSGAAPVPGSAGTDTALPSTDSAVTASGRGRFSDLRVTVNQTEDLVNQAISVTWSGGTPTKALNGARFGENYLQIMQCWGEPDGTSSENPGPPPEQCVFGATDAVYGSGRNNGIFPAGGWALERIITRTDQPNFDPDVGHLDEDSRQVWRPFRAVGGKEITIHYDYAFTPSNPSEEHPNYWLNDSFNAITTNEVSGGLTRADGTGEALFEVATGVQSSGLGCGQRVQPNPGGAPTIPKCWLVIVPRGEAGAENAGTDRDASKGVNTSPLSPAAWENRIAVPLEFTPVDTACDISRTARRIGGSELPVPAIANWQPSLCASGDLPPYTYSTMGDTQARTQLLLDVEGTPGMVVVSRPIDPGRLAPSNPVLYVPLTVSALTIGFNVERAPIADAPAEEEALRSVRVEEINLTPRLVAKLLTQSYRSQTAIQGTTPYEWAKKNPANLGVDPDFVQFNPEFELLLTPNSKNFGGVIAPALTSDAARQVWQWILADPEAKAWLDGEADEFGMVVNPVYLTDASKNPAGVSFADPIPETFPKSDPHCFQGEKQGPGANIIPPPMCGTDWLPYAQSIADAARAVRVADDGARTSHDPFAINSSGVYRRNGPQVLGSRGILAIVDTPSAIKYGLQTARLSRAGDNGDDRSFIAPDDDGMRAGVAAMKPGAVQEVVEADPTADAPDAYPLTTLTYAAIAPLTLEDEARAEYAAFLGYAVGDGQVQGLGVGQLRPGFVPLPPAMQSQAKKAVLEVTALGIDEDDREPPTSTPSVPESSETSTQTTPSDTRATSGLGSSTPIASSFDPSSLPQLPAESEPDDDGSGGSGALTPVLALARNRFVLPVLVLVALGSALGAVEITRRPGPQPTGGPPTPAEGAL